MYLVIPLILIVSSAAGIGYIVWPKIKELKNDENLPELKEDLWHLFFPEFFRVWDGIDFQGFKRNALSDYEKFLRRVRILSLRTDNFVNRLLEKRQKKVPKPEFIESDGSADETKSADAYFKTKENNLIAEIAKNPKDKNLYKALGALYFERKLYDDAREVFNVVLELDPNDLEIKEAFEKIAKMT